MTAINYHNQLANFEIQDRVKFVDDNGQIFTAIIVNIQDDLLDLYFEDVPNSQGLESPASCYQV